MSQPLICIENTLPCTIVQRLNRFVVEVLVSGDSTRAYINNTGRLLEYLVEGRRAYCLPFSEPKKTSHRLFAVEDPPGAALIDTRLQMRAFEYAVEQGLIPWLEGYRILRREPTLGDSRLDYLLEGKGSRLYLEIKSAVLRDGAVAMYPDCPTRRGQRHIRELIQHVKAGGRGTILFLAALPGVRAFRTSPEGDPAIPPLLWEARQVGVEIRSLGMHYAPGLSSVVLDNADLPVLLQRDQAE
jgi:sugar fermentation stimulation protein A